MTEDDVASALGRGIGRFNRGEYHQALDEFETAYHARPKAEGTLFLGLIRAAGALYHFEKGQPHSARRLYASAREVLGGIAAAPAERVAEGIDLAALLAGLDQVFAPLLAAPPDQASTLRPVAPPRIQLTRLP